MSPNAQFLTDVTGNRTAVLLPIDEYDSLLEDLHDLAVIAERREEPRIALSEIKARLLKDGLIHN